MKNIFIYIILSLVVFSTPSEFIAINETLLGVASNNDEYYTLLVEIDNPGSYYIDKQEIYLVTYNNKGLKTKKKLKSEMLYVNEDKQKTDHTVKSKNSKELVNLLNKDINFFTHTYPINDKDEKYEIKEDGIYKINKENEEKLIVKKEDIIKKLSQVYSGDKNDLISEYETFEVLSHFSNNGISFYLIEAEFDFLSFNIIVKATS